MAGLLIICPPDVLQLVVLGTYVSTLSYVRTLNCTQPYTGGLPVTLCWAQQYVLSCCLPVHSSYCVPHIVEFKAAENNM
jgi:hypothetical protein